MGHFIKEQENCSDNNRVTCLKRLADQVLQRANQKNTIETYSQNTVPPANKAGTDLKDLSYEFEERAAIIEFDGGFSREEAENLARIETNLLRGRK